jgi:acyl transferase domain-containing protein
MDGRGDRGESVAIIGMACRFPGARDPAEFHDLAVAGRDMFQPVAALPDRPLRAAVLDDWSFPQIADDPVTGGFWPDVGPVRKLAAEMTALALTDAGLREVAGTCRTGLIIASSVPGLGEQVREEFGFPARGLFSCSAYVSSLHAVVAAAGALQTGQLDLAVAGGVELGLDPVWLALQDRAGALGAGEMRVYAADPAGLLPGEGCGMVVLVRAAYARSAGVPVYAEIAGWSTPPAGSERSGPVLLQAYQRAGVDPADVQLIEGQGIGTAPGDSAELAALTQLRRGGRDHGTVAALGAISACIGYARAAAGIASLVKAGCAESAAGQPTLLAASLQALRTLDALGVRPAIGVGYGLAEITGLAWAGCIPMAEAARLVAQCGQVLRACAYGTAVMARVTADAETARLLSAAGGLHIAAYEGPRTHVLAGSTACVRELTRRAAVLGVAVEVLDGGKGSAPMHSPGMARCAAPLRSVFAGTSFGPPRRRLISTITGRLVTAEDDMARLLAGQVTRPVLFAQAMAQAAAGADLIMTAGLGPDAGLTARAAECGGVPAVPIPAALPPGNTDPRGRPGAALTQALAALFTAGALTDLRPFLPGANAGEEGRAREGITGGGREMSGSTLASRTVPRMRAAEEAGPSGPASAGAVSCGGAGNPARSVT